MPLACPICSEIWFWWFCFLQNHFILYRSWKMCLIHIVNPQNFTSSRNSSDDTPLCSLVVDFLSPYISLGGTHGGRYKQSICTGDSSCEGEQTWCKQEERKSEIPPTRNKWRRHHSWSQMIWELRIQVPFQKKTRLWYLGHLFSKRGKNNFPFFSQNNLTSLWTLSPVNIQILFCCANIWYSKSYCQIILAKLQISKTNGIPKCPTNVQNIWINVFTSFAFIDVLTQRFCVYNWLKLNQYREIS